MSNKGRSRRRSVSRHCPGSLPPRWFQPPPLPCPPTASPPPRPRWPPRPPGDGRPTRRGAGPSTVRWRRSPLLRKPARTAACSPVRLARGAAARFRMPVAGRRGARPPLRSRRPSRRSNRPHRGRWRERSPPNTGAARCRSFVPGDSPGTTRCNPTAPTPSRCAWSYGAPATAASAGSAAPSMTTARVRSTSRSPPPACMDSVSRSSPTCQTPAGARARARCRRGGSASTTSPRRWRSSRRRA